MVPSLTLLPLGSVAPHGGIALCLTVLVLAIEPGLGALTGLRAVSREPYEAVIRRLERHGRAERLAHHTHGQHRS